LALGFHFQDTWKSRCYTNCAAARTPGDFAYAKAFPGETGITFLKLADDKREAHRAMQVKSANLFHFCAKTISKRALEPRLRGHSQYSLGKKPFQPGRNFVFGPGDVDRFAAFSAKRLETTLPIQSLLGSTSLSYRRSLIFLTFAAPHVHLELKRGPIAHPLRTISAPAAPFASAPDPVPKFGWSSHR